MSRPLYTLPEYAPHTGFGVDYNSSVKFTIDHPDGLGFPSWAGGSKNTEHDHANGDGISIQYHGKKPWSINFMASFDNEYDLERVEEMIGTQATLRYRQGLTRRVGGIEEEIAGVMYLTLSDTYLRWVSESVLYEDGTCEALLSFVRAYVEPEPREAIIFPETPPIPVEDSSNSYGYAIYGSSHYGPPEDDG
jgi:hypothetical protein